MIFNVLDFQISTANRIYYLDLLSVETENSDMADGLYSLFHLAFVDGTWYFDLLWLGKPYRALVAHIFS